MPECISLLSLSIAAMAALIGASLSLYIYHRCVDYAQLIRGGKQAYLRYALFCLGRPWSMTSTCQLFLIRYIRSMSRNLLKAHFPSNSTTVMSSNDNFISRAVQSGVATAGGYAGGVVDAAGKSVSGAGRNVGNRYVFRKLSSLL